MKKKKKSIRAAAVLVWPDCLGWPASLPVGSTTMKEMNHGR